MNRYHLIAILGFVLGLLTAATLMFAYLGDPNAVTSGFAGLATIWLIYSYVPEEGTLEDEEPGDFDHVGKQPSSPAPACALALQGGQEPPGSTGAGETDGCPICGEPWKDHDFGIPHPVCPKAPLPGKSWYDKISPAPVVGGAGGESPAEPEENAGAGGGFVQNCPGVSDGDLCNRIDGTNELCKGRIRLREPEGRCRCSAMSNPPCSYCESPVALECPECGWEEGE